MTRTWPEDWDARKRGVGCWFCGNQIGEPFYAGTAGDGYLERHAIAPGHAIVIFRDRHVADFTSLTTTEVAEYWRDVHVVARMIEHASAHSLRESPEWRLVSPNFTSWNRIGEWLRRAEAIRYAA